MGRNLVAPVVIALGIAALAVTQAAWAETRAYNLSGFTGITASASSNVVLKQGPFSVSVETRNGDFTDLIVEVRGDTLVVGRKSHGWNWGKSPSYVVTVTAPAIDDLQASSSADIVATNYSFKDLDVSVSSSGNVSLSGTCASIEVDVNSSGDFRGKDLHCEAARVDASSSGDADVYASKKARGSASSSGDIRFHGSPASLEKHTSSSGSVETL